MTSYAHVSEITQEILARTGLPYELIGLEIPTAPWDLCELTFLDPTAPPWARTFQLPLEWDAGTTEAAASEALEQLLRDHRDASRS